MFERRHVVGFVLVWVRKFRSMGPRVERSTGLLALLQSLLDLFFRRALAQLSIVVGCRRVRIKILILPFVRPRK